MSTLRAGRPKRSGTTAFYILLVTQTLSLIGSRMSAVGLGIWVFRETGQTTPLLLTAFFAELPGMAVGSAAGVLVDRWDRRRVLMLADAGQALGTVLLLLTFLAGTFAIWQLYAVALLQGVFATLQGPARDAAVTTLIRDNHRERANAFLEMSYNLAGVLAPVLAGALFGWAGISGIIVLDLATFVFAVAALLPIAIPRPPRTAEGRIGQGSLRRELAAGLHFLRARPPLLVFTLYNVFLNFALNGPLGVALPYFIARTGRDVAVGGGLMGVMSLGALTGAGLVAVWGGTRPRIHALMLGYLVTGIAFLILGVARAPLLLGAAVFLLMVPLPFGNTLGLSIWQLKTPPDLQGRIFALNSQLGFLGSTASFLLTGPLVDRLLEPAVSQRAWTAVAPLVGAEAGAGMGLLLFVTGLLILVVTAAVYARPLIRHMEATLPDYEAAERPLMNVSR